MQRWRVLAPMGVGVRRALRRGLAVSACTGQPRLAHISAADVSRRMRPAALDVPTDGHRHFVGCETGRVAAPPRSVRCWWRPEDGYQLRAGATRRVIELLDYIRDRRAEIYRQSFATIRAEAGPFAVPGTDGRARVVGAADPHLRTGRRLPKHIAFQRWTVVRQEPTPQLVAGRARCCVIRRWSPAGITKSQAACRQRGWCRWSPTPERGRFWPTAPARTRSARRGSTCGADPARWGRWWAIGKTRPHRVVSGLLELVDDGAPTPGPRCWGGPRSGSSVSAAVKNRS